MVTTGHLSNWPCWQQAAYFLTGVLAERKTSCHGKTPDLQDRFGLDLTPPKCVTRHKPTNPSGPRFLPVYMGG